MGVNWGLAGLVGLGVLLLSPRARQELRSMFNNLAAEMERAAQRKEAEQRKAELREIFNQLQWPPSATPSPKSDLVIPASVESDAQWREVILPPAIVLVLGKRGSGKSALAYRLLELFRYRLTPYVVSVPEQANKLLPDWIGTVPTLEELPSDCIALVDEAYIHFHSRRSMAHESASMSQQLNLSRQRNQTLIFVSQEARQVDRNIASSASVVVFKEMGMLQPEFDRPELRKLVEQANNAMAGLGKEIKKWAFVYSPDADHIGLLESQLPSFWKPSMSRLYATGPRSTSQRPGAKLTPENRADRAKDLRAKGYTYSQIANDLGVSKGTVLNYLKGYPYQKG